MKTETTKKVIVKVASEEQHDNLRNQRKTLKVLQQSANKENLTGRSVIIKDEKSNDHETEIKRKKMLHKSMQTGEATITADDLTADEPSEDYWRLLAEKRGAALDDSLHENDKLKEHIKSLKEENDVCKEMLDESKHLIEVLQEMIDEQESELKVETADEATENS